MMAGSGKNVQHLSGAQSMTHLQAVKEGLKACKGTKGFFNPQEAFACLNDIQKKEDPKAYENEIEQAYEMKK